MSLSISSQVCAREYVRTLSRARVWCSKTRTMVALCFVQHLHGKPPNKGKKINVLFNDTLNTFCLRLWRRTLCKGERGNPLPPLYGLLFPISSKGSFICTIPQTG